MDAQGRSREERQGGRKPRRIHNECFSNVVGGLRSYFPASQLCITHLSIVLRKTRKLFIYSLSSPVLSVIHFQALGLFVVVVIVVSFPFLLTKLPFRPDR